MSSKIKVGISIGDLNGIGIEIILKVFSNSDIFDFCIPIVYGSTRVISYYKKSFDIEVPMQTINSAKDAVSDTMNVINCWNEEVKIEMGKATSISGKYAYQSLKSVTDDVLSNNIDVMVTAPIEKSAIQSKEFTFPGHTEFLANQCKLSGNELMLLVNDKLRVATVTGHIPLTKVSESITKDLIIKKLLIFNKSLVQDFMIRKPKIAVLSLNPHCGDSGLLGNEEIEIIQPALEEVKELDVLAFGPYPADGFFGKSDYLNFDGVLAMYHDQGLTPFKTISFDAGVNYTAGLPIIRTSPDHGVAYEIAGKNLASKKSMLEAIFLACDIYKNRAMSKKLTKNVLRKQDIQ